MTEGEKTNKQICKNWQLVLDTIKSELEPNWEELYLLTAGMYYTSN